MPSKKALSISLIIMVLLGGIYGFLVLTGEETIDPDEVYATTGMTVDAMTLTEIEPTTVMGLTVNCEHGDAMELEYTVHGWKVKGNHDIPLDDSLVEQIVNPLCAVMSDRMLTDDPAAKAEYGLDPARYTVTLTDSDDVAYTFHIGNKHPTTYKYYFNIDGEDEIYTVPTGVAMNLEDHHSIASLIKPPFFPAPSAEATDAIVIETGDRRVEIVHLPEGSEECWTSEYTWFCKEADGTMIPLDETEFSYFLNVISGLGYLQTVNYSEDPAVLEQYGLVEGKQHKISMSYESASRGDVTDVIYIGQGADGTSYARVEGSGVIGSIANKFDYFSFDADKYRAADFFRLLLDTVDSLTVRLEGQTHEIDIERTLELGSDGSEKVLSSYHYNGKQLDNAAFSAFYNGMRNTVKEGTFDGTPDSAPYMTITFGRNTANHSEMTLKIWEFDSHFYISEFAGSTVLVNRNDINTLIDNLNAMLESEAA